MINELVTWVSVSNGEEFSSQRESMTFQNSGWTL